MRSMRSRKLLTALTCCVALAQAVHATDNTHIDNHCKTWTIIATTSYPGGNSKFINRHIPPGGSDVDSYNPVDHVDIEVQVDGNPLKNRFTIRSDQSVIAVDTPGNQYGVDFWLNDGKGKPVTTNPLTRGPWSSLVTIFGPGPPPSASPSPPASTSPSTVPTDPTDDGDDDQGCEGPDDSAAASLEKQEHRMRAWNDANTAEFPASGIYYKKTTGKWLGIPFSKRCAYCNAFAIDTTHIMTAAHCVFKSGSYNYEGASVKLAKVGKKASGKEVFVRRCLVPDPYKENPLVADYAVCLVDNIGSVGSWTMGTLNQINPNSNYNLLTYPLTREASFGGDITFKKTPWKASCPQLGSGNPNVLYLDCKTFPGDSGAAMFDNNHNVIAVMKGGSTGFIFTTTVRQTIADFVRQLQ